MSTKLTGTARAEAMTWCEGNGWSPLEDRDGMSKTFKFNNFAEAFGWMTRIAIIADKMNHHPEWSNVYNRVEVVLTTHDVDGLSELDLTLAQVMEG